ncbi:MAG TPA: type I-B CRISPR-associated protein Cas5b [Methanofastidiosum sp.]|nr:type I-B CRISPR-associated protein Cas5b [Methanofastidiosum sp.]
MEVLRVKLRSLTSTFRYHTFQSGQQPTLPMPPISTLVGLLSAAKGDIVSIDQIDFLGYIFFTKGNGTDLEKTYYLGGDKQDILKKDFLVDNTLYLYLPLSWENYLKNPRYQLLLGRSSDLAYIDEIKKVNLDKKSNVQISNTIVPLGTINAFGTLQPMPIEFNYSQTPRRVKKLKPFILVSQSFNYPNEAFYDPELDMGVWIYEKEYLS